MVKKFSVIIWLFLFFSSSLAVAAPTLETAQREVDKLRTLAAAKYEAANEATIRIKQLQAETSVLRKKEEGLRKELDASAKFLAQIAIAQYKANGLGQGLELLFSADPTKFLSDAATLDVLSRGYSEQLREFETNKQRVEASQIVVSDRTTLLKAQQAKLNREITQAKAALQRAEKILKSLKKEDRERLAAEEAARESKILKDSKKYATSFKGDNSRGSLALRYALSQVGDIYVWAAAGPTRWDCSGLTMRAFQKAGVSLPHSSRIQVKYGKSISYGSLKPGDLVFFGRPISHVSIYMGGGKMVHAPRPGKRVEVVAMTKKFGSKPFVAAKRL